MEMFQERPLPLRCVLRLQRKTEEANTYILSTLPVWEKAVADGDLRSATIFTFMDQIFVYYESNKPFVLDEYLPEIGQYVHMWPSQETPRPYFPLIKYYQSLPMEAVKDWDLGDRAIPRLMISRMNIEKLQSYIYYHYLMQEEVPGYNGRYLGIWGSEDWCVLYDEKDPARPIDTDYQGKLTTKECPLETWQKCMNPHFNTWADGNIYQYGEILLHV